MFIPSAHPVQCKQPVSAYNQSLIYDQSKLKHTAMYTIPTQISYSPKLWKNSGPISWKNHKYISKTLERECSAVTAFSPFGS